MSEVKSDNRHLSILTGYGTRWAHNTGNTSTAQPTTYANKAGEPFVLRRLVINTSSASAITLTDTGNATNSARVIANLKASVSEGTYSYDLPLLGSLKVDNPGGSDLTIVFANN